MSLRVFDNKTRQHRWARMGKIMVLKFPSWLVECKINADASEMRAISEGLKAIYFVSFIQGVKKRKDFHLLFH